MDFAFIEDPGQASSLYIVTRGVSNQAFHEVLVLISFVTHERLVVGHHNVVVNLRSRKLRSQGVCHTLLSTWCRRRDAVSFLYYGTGQMARTLIMGRPPINVLAPPSP